MGDREIIQNVYFLHFVVWGLKFGWFPPQNLSFNVFAIQAGKCSLHY